MTRALLALLACAACTGTNGVAPVASADLAGYASSVHPILEARCATLDCHGDPGRPLRLYAETGLRAADLLRGQPITMDELVANVRALEGVDPGVPADASIVMAKPLGRIDHVGGVVWADPGAAQPTCVRGWLAGSLDAAACRTADAEVALPPP